MPFESYLLSSLECFEACSAWASPAALTLCCGSYNLHPSSITPFGPGATRKQWVDAVGCIDIAS